MAEAPPGNQQPTNNIILKLKSKDGEVFDVEKPVAMQINFVKGMLEDVDEMDGMEIPMGEVDACILAKVVEFCKFHHQQEINQTSADDIDRWEKSFVQVDKSTLFQLILVCLFNFRSSSSLDLISRSFHLHLFLLTFFFCSVGG